MMTFLSGRCNRFSKLLDRIGFGKKSGSFNEQRGHAICLTVARCVDDAQARGKFNTFRASDNPLMASGPSGKLMSVNKMSMYSSCSKRAIASLAFAADKIT